METNQFTLVDIWTFCLFMLIETCDLPNSVYGETSFFGLNFSLIVKGFWYYVSLIKITFLLDCYLYWAMRVLFLTDDNYGFESLRDFKLQSDRQSTHPMQV